MYNAIVLPHFDYADIILAANKFKICKVLKLEQPD